VIVVFCLKIASKGKIYGYSLALTFAIYVFYDAVRLFSISLFDGLLYPLFFIATVSALFSVWKLSKDK